MRTIKFRAWNKNLKEYAFGVDLVFTKEVLSSVRHEDWEGDSEPEAWNPGIDGYVEPSEVIIEQFTGLLDKNGKEIYEGDIIKEADGEPNIVCFFDGGFTITNEKETYHGSLEFLRQFHDIYGVIGNIHENPELL